MRELIFKGLWYKDQLISKLKDESGMGVIEIAIIILVLIAIALLFKEKIWEMAKDLIESMDVTDASEFK
jgi:hypothetical protein